MNVKALSLSLGIVWASIVTLAGWFAIGGWGEYLVEVLSSFYLGYDATFSGAIIGGIWSFAEGSILGFALGFLYNVFSNQKSKNKKIFTIKSKYRAKTLARPKTATRSKSKPRKKTT